MAQTIQQSTFKKIGRNPLPRLIRETENIIPLISKTFDVPVWRLTTSCPRLPLLYGLPKIHKKGEDAKKMRPIISNVNAPSYFISKWVVQELKKLPPPPGLFVKNSFDFVQKLSRYTIEEDEVMMTCDVESLYPNIPVPEALDIANNWLFESELSDKKADVLFRAMKLCMNQNEFMYNGIWYKQTFGVNMGNPLSCSIANILMGKFEQDLKDKNLLPKL